MATSKLQFERNSSCPVCSSTPDRWRKRAETWGAEPFRSTLFAILQCGVCGLGITDPVPSEATAIHLYGDRTSNDFQADDSTLTSSLKSLAAARDIRAFFGVRRSFNRPSRLLDFSCGNGDFALAMKRHFVLDNVFASDVHNTSPRQLLNSGVSYICDDELEAHGTFDFILCRHVLEHTYDPVAILRRLGSLLSDDAILAIEVPNLDAPMGRAFGKYWDGYYAPYHPIHFTKESLSRVVLSSGLVPFVVGGSEMPKIGRSLQNIYRGNYNFGLFFAGVALHPLQLIAGAITGQPTCLRLWATKARSV